MSMTSKIPAFIDQFNKKFSLSSGLTVFNRLFAVFIMGFMFIVVARTLGPSGQGIVATLVAMITIAIQFGNLGLYASNIRFVGADRSLYRQAAGNSLAIGSVLGLLMAAMLVGVYLISPSLFPDITLLLIAFYAASLPFSLLTMLFQGMLLAVEDIVKYNLLIFARAVVLVGGVVVILMFLGGGVLELILFLVAVEVLFAATYGGVVYLKEKFSFTIDAEFLKKMVGYGFKVYLATQLTYLVLKFDIIMVNYYLGSYQAGIYSVSSKMADMVKLIPETVALIFFPRATALKDKAKPFANKVLLVIGVFMLFMCLFLYFTAQPILLALFGQEYAGSVEPFIWLIPGIFFISIEVLLMNYFASKQMPLYVVFTPLVGLSVNVGLNMMWLPKYGIVAAAWTSTISYTVMFLMLALKYRTSR
ncbi:MAG: oligosaccharide flippase family protein [Candidatus Altiarchaeota archaeon]